MKIDSTVILISMVTDFYACSRIWQYFDTAQIVLQLICGALEVVLEIKFITLTLNTSHTPVRRAKENIPVLNKRPQ
jgi:hypothetical protein